MKKYSHMQTMLLFLVPTLLWLGFVVLSQMTVYSLESNDCLFYIQNVENFVAGQGFTHHQPADFWDTEGVLEPTRLFPPGFPLMASPLLYLGLSAYQATWWTAAISSLAALWLILWFYRQCLPFTYALAAAIPMAISLRLFSFYCQSEGVYLLLSTVALVTIYLAMRGGRVRFGWLLVAGLAGGYAWTVRNVGVALFAATLIYLVMYFVAKKDIRLGLAGIGLWLTGWIAGSGWLLIYYWRTFGTLKPYVMPPSGIGFFENCRWFLAGLWGQGVYYASILYPRKMTLLLAVAYLFVAAALAVVLWTHRRRVRLALLRMLKRNPFPLYLTLYGLGIGGVTILARTTYQWGEWINTRHHYPIDWIKCYLIALVAWFLVELLKVSPRVRNGCLAAGVCVCCMLPFYAFHTYANIYPQVFRPAEMQRLAEIVPEGKVLISNHPFYVEVLAGRACRPAADVTLETLKEGMRNGKFAGVVFTDVHVLLREWENDDSREAFLKPILAAPEKVPGFKKIELSPHATVLLYEGKQTQEQQPGT